MAGITRRLAVRDPGTQRPTITFSSAISRVLGGRRYLSRAGLQPVYVCGMRPSRIAIENRHLAKRSSLPHSLYSQLVSITGAPYQ